MEPGTTFQPILPGEENPSPSATKRLILCSGKHYYTLHEHLAKSASDLRQSTSIIRIEELSPFPRKELREVVQPYLSGGSLEKVIWAQEEPENQGPWAYVQPRITEVLKEVGLNGIEEVKYAGRRSGATVAVAVGEWHKKEMKEIVEMAMEV